MKFRDKPVEELKLSVRLYSCLKNAELSTVGQVVKKTEAELLKTKNFGRKSLTELKEVLAGLGLHLGMRDDDEEPGMPVRQPNKPLMPAAGARQRSADD